MSPKHTRLSQNNSGYAKKQNFMVDLVTKVTWKWYM